MERNFTVVTDYKNKLTLSMFRFKEKKATELARHMNSTTNTSCYTAIEIPAEDADKFIAYEPIETIDGKPREDGKCEQWGLYDVTARVFKKSNQSGATTISKGEKHDLYKTI